MLGSVDIYSSTTKNVGFNKIKDLFRQIRITILLKRAIILFKPPLFSQRWINVNRP